MTVNYVAEAMNELGARLPGCPAPLLRLYALLVLVKGVDTSNEDVHDAWSVWCDLDTPGHRSLIPFDDLTPEVQALDTKYRDAIREVAAL